MLQLSDDLKNVELQDEIFKDVKYYVSGDVHERVLELLRDGGATRRNYFSDYVTHLICGTDAEETDLSDANELYEIPAVTVKWVFMCARLKRLLSTKPYVFSPTKLFTNCVFCLSALDSDRNSLWAIITYHGGVVQLNLDRRCTHLLTTSTTTDKYVKAEALGPERVQIVTPDWIVESVKCNSLAQADLFHPRLIAWPKVVKHESTTAITGFEPEQSELDEKALEISVPDSTQALLDKLKQRMPWNQPQVTSSSEPAPPNIVAPSFASVKLPQVQEINQSSLQQKLFGQHQLVQQLNLPKTTQIPTTFPNTSQQQQLNILTSASQVPRSIVHHTPQSTLVNQQQVHQVQQQAQQQQAQQQQVQQQQVHQQQQQQQVQQQQIHQQQQQTHQPQHQQLPALQQSQEQQQFGINQQSVVFSQANLTANQKLNRVLEQFRQRSSIQTHLNRLNQMEQQNQFSQLQRNQPNQLQQLNLQNQQTVQVSQESQVGQQLRQVNQIVQGNQSSQLGLNLQQLSANNQQLTQRSQQLEQGGSQVAQGLQQLVQGGRLVQGGQRPQQILQGNQHLLQNQLCQMNQLGQINQPQVSQLEQAGQQSSIPQLQIAQSQQNVVQHPTLSQIAKPPTGIQQQLSHLTPEQILNRQILGQNQQINQQLMKNQQMGQNHVNQQLLQNTQQLLQNQQGHLNQQLLQNQQQIGQQQPSQLSQQQQNQLNQQQQTQLTQQQQNQINQQEQNQLNQQLSQQKQNQVAQQQQNQITQQQQNQLSQLNQQQQIQLDQLNLQQNQVCKLKQQLSQLEQQRSNQVSQQQQQNQLNQLNIQQNQLAKLNQQLSQLEQQRNQREQQRSNQVSQQQLLQNQQQLVQNQQIGQNPLEQQLVQNQLSQQLAQNQLGPRRLGLNQHLLQTQIGQQLVQTQLGQQQQQQGQLVQQQTIVQNQMNQQIGQISQQLQQNQLEQSSLTQQQQQQIRQGQHLLQSQIGQSQLPQQLGQQIAQGQLGQQQLNLQQNKLIQNQFGSQQIVNQNQQQQQQQFSNPPASTQQQFGQQGQHFSQAQQAFNQISQGSQSQLIQGQQQGQFVQGQQVVTGQQQLIKTQQPIGSQQIVPQQQMINQKLAVQQLANQPIGGQQHILINQQQQQQQQITQNPLQQFAQQENQPNQIAQPNLSNQPAQQRATAPHLWQQQQRLNIRQLNLQQQGPRVQWPPNQQQGVVPQRQFIQLDSQTHQQLQQMSPEERAQFITRLHKQRQIQLAQRMQQRGGHILIRGGPVPPGLNPQQQLQWVQQQAKQQGLVFQSNIQQNNTPVQQTANVAQNVQHAPGLSPIQQNAPFNDQSQQLQLQRQQFRIQQLQLQREQAQKTPAPAPALLPTTPVPQPSIVRPIGQPQTVDPNTAIGADPNIQQNPLVVNPKTKTALANMLSIRLQSGGSALTENIAEPSAAGTLRLMTAQHNAALNSNNRPQELLALQQRRIINRPNGDLIRPPAPPSVPPTPQGEPPKLQYSPRNTVPLQHRPGTYYGHNPNLKLPPDLFLLGCVFVVVELERFLDESLPGWQKKIEKHGGEIEKQYCNRVTHVICETQRHGVVMQALRDFKRCVTLYWLSDVIHRKQVLPPWIALHLPTMYWDTAPASKHLISLSGFTGTERERVKHMIKYIGATLTTYFSKHNTLLIVSRAEGSKCLHAKKWGVPVVNIQWLTDVMLGHFTALSQMEHIKYQQFSDSPNFSFDPVVVPTLMHAWKMPINISQESYEKVKRSASPVVFPPKAKKMKMEHHTDENDNQDNCGIFSNHRILFSMFADTTELKEIVRQLGGSLASSPKDCTHLVMPQLTRSNKLLFCICIGAHILPESWLRDSQSANKFLDESNYSLDTKEFNSVYKCDFTQTLMTKNRNKLFEGKYFYVTPSVYLGKDNLAKLIQCCGGIVERTRRTLSQIEATNINSPYSYIILTHENDLHLVADLLKNKKDKIRIVCNGELIFSAILRQTFEVEPYAVKVL